MGCPRFIYCFQNKSRETYEKYLKHKKDFPFTVVSGLETVNFLHSFGQTEEELKFMKITKKFYRYIDNDNLIYFRDACDDVL